MLNSSASAFSPSFSLPQAQQSHDDLYGSGYPDYSGQGQQALYERTVFSEPAQRPVALTTIRFDPFQELLWAGDREVSSSASPLLPELKGSRCCLHWAHVREIYMLASSFSTSGFVPKGISLFPSVCANSHFIGEAYSSRSRSFMHKLSGNFAFIE